MPAPQRMLARNRDTTRFTSVTASALDIPTQLLDITPACAQACLSSFINTQFACAGDSLSCLCSKYSSDGYALGELGYLCLESYCPDAPENQAAALYGICDTQQGAAKATHSTLTRLSPSSTFTQRSISMSNTATVTSSTRPSSNVVLSATTSNLISSAPTPTADPTSTQASTLTEAPVFATANRSVADTTKLTSAQSVGISIAAFGAMMLIIGAIFIVAWWRRRKVAKAAQHLEKKRHSYDFVDDAPPRFSPFNYGTVDPRGPLGGFHRQRVELSSEKKERQWPGRMRDVSPLPPANYGAQDHAAGNFPPTSRSVSPETVDSTHSTRTISQLLPERPRRSPPMSYKKPAVRPGSWHTEVTDFEEDHRSPNIGQYPLPALPKPPRAARQPVSNVLGQRRHLAQDIRPPAAARQPPLSLDIPKKAPPQDRPPSLKRLSVRRQSSSNEPAIGLAKGHRPASTASQAHSATSIAMPKSGASLIPDYYTSTESGSPINSPTPIDEDVSSPAPAPNSTALNERGNPPARPVRQSSASDTSFESTDPDEPTPPDEEEKRLSPVAESPASYVRYPKVPRSCNQSVPRSPKPQPSPRIKQQPIGLPAHPAILRKPVVQQQLVLTIPPSSSPRTPDRNRTPQPGFSPDGPTLVAKRRGNGMAKTLEHGLHLDKTELAYPRQQSTSIGGSPTKRSNTPLKGYGRVASGATTRRPSYTGSEYCAITPPDSAAAATQGQMPKQRTAMQEISIKSPLWAPKLTPERRGDDLFISVSLATPCATPKHPNWNTRERLEAY